MSLLGPDSSCQQNQMAFILLCLISLHMKSSWFLQCSKHVRIFFPLDGCIQLMLHSHRFSLHAFSLPWVRNVCQDRHLVQQLIVEVLTYHRLKSRCPSDSSFLITRDLGDSKRWLTYLGLCNPCERFRLSQSWLRAAAGWGSIWRVKYAGERSLSACLCHCFLPFK